MTEYTRAHIRLMTTKEADEFVRLLNSDATIDKYVLETGDANYRVSARSYLGVIYFVTEHNDETYLVNMTNDGVYLPEINKFRI